jgi:hypothetical protein
VDWTNPGSRFWKSAEYANVSVPDGLAALVGTGACGALATGEPDAAGEAAADGEATGEAAAAGAGEADGDAPADTGDAALAAGGVVAAG